MRASTHNHSEFRIIFAAAELFMTCLLCSTPFLTEDGLLDMIRASVRAEASGPEKTKNSAHKVPSSVPKGSPRKVDAKSMPSIFLLLWLCCCKTSPTL